MAVAILIIGVGFGFGLSVAAWVVTSSFLLALLAYSAGGTLGCLMAGVGVFLCQRRNAGALALRR